MLPDLFFRGRHKILFMNNNKISNCLAYVNGIPRAIEITEILLIIWSIGVRVMKIGRHRPGFNSRTRHSRA